MKQVWLVYSMSEDGTMYVTSEHDSREDAQVEASKMNAKPLSSLSFGVMSLDDMRSDLLTNSDVKGRIRC